jgi:hypothetical protein
LPHPSSIARKVLIDWLKVCILYRLLCPWRAGVRTIRHGLGVLVS